MASRLINAYSNLVKKRPILAQIGTAGKFFLILSSTIIFILVYNNSVYLMLDC